MQTTTPQQRDAVLDLVMTTADATSDRHEDLASRAVELGRNTYADDSGREHCTWCKAPCGDGVDCPCVCDDCGEICRGPEHTHITLRDGGAGVVVRCSSCTCALEGAHEVSGDDDVSWCDRCGAELGYQEDRR